MGRAKRALLTALTFGGVGPLAGTLAFAVAGVAAGADMGEGGIAALAILWMLPFGYVLGFLPAALTGALVGAAAPQRPAWLYVLIAGAVGAAVAGGYAFFDSSERTVSEGVINLALIGAVGGLASGLVSAVLSHRRTAAA